MYFTYDFERNDLTPFTSASGSVQSSVKYSGSYAGLNGNNTNFLKNFGTPYPKVFAEARFRWTDTPGYFWIVMVGDGPANGQFLLYTYNGKLYFSSNSRGFYGTKTLVKDTWYKIVVEFYCHDSAGYAKVFVDGVLDIDTGAYDSKNGSDTGVQTIKWQGTNDVGVNCYVDNCIAADYDYRWGMVISESGKDVKDCLDSEKIFDSNLNMLKTAAVRTQSVGDYTHGLGFTPIMLAAEIINSNNSGLIGQFAENSVIRTDGTYLSNLDSGGHDFEVYLLYQDGA